MKQAAGCITARANKLAAFRCLQAGIMRMNQFIIFVTIFSCRHLFGKKQ